MAHCLKCILGILKDVSILEEVHRIVHVLLCTAVTKGEMSTSYQVLRTQPEFDPWTIVIPPITMNIL